MAEAPASTSGTTTAASSASSAADEPKAKSGASCSVCGKSAEAYEGDNPHKQGSVWCAEHGRQPAKS